MKIYLTEFRAKCALSNQLKSWDGQNVQALTWKDAQEWCYRNAGHLVVIGELVAEIPCKKGTFDPDFDNMIDYEKSRLN